MSIPQAIAQYPFFCSQRTAGGGWTEAETRDGVRVMATTHEDAALRYAVRHSARSMLIRVVGEDGRAEYYEKVVSVDRTEAPRDEGDEDEGDDDQDADCPRCPVAGVCTKCGRHWSEACG